MAETRCPHCNWADDGRHAGGCPETLKTPEQRIARATHITQCFDPWRSRQILEEEGLTDDEIREGFRLGNIEKEKRALDRIINGDPAYGRLPKK